MATIKDVAKLAGVAVSTASYALNSSSKVSPDTARKVLDAAKQLNYQKNGLARDLKLSKTDTIGLILSNMSGPFYSELINGVQEVSMSHGYGLIACSSLNGDTKMAHKFIQERRVDGVIILAHSITDEMIIQSARRDFPIVVLDRVLPHEHVMNVASDNVTGGYLATKHLLDSGHTDIRYVAGSANSRDNDLRFQGYLKALQEKGITPLPNWNIQGGFTKEAGYRVGKLLVMQGQLPTALFCVNDEVAIGVIQAFDELGVRIPDDVSIVGFDNIEISQYVTPSLTTVNQSKYEMGQLAAHLVFQALQGDVPKKEYILPTNLVLRKSTVEKR
ncbi:LacI family DNA-binding transcriptional regulator [Bacillus horti]|uniref:LacI family transcriptional regulator n=1 Tax=Caldalkalibacillus horti TaxID=77523 RepID=A0ABT9W576_9BACI|nr:LacI family DNA-binding transcriptional regulator [Bacillus horti]MDQ0168402.1 LacI family transcriptional regulator [Bacillus horti]